MLELFPINTAILPVTPFKLISHCMKKPDKNCLETMALE